MAKWLEKTLGEVTAFIAKGIPPKYTEEENAFADTLADTYDHSAVPGVAAENDEDAREEVEKMQKAYGHAMNGFLAPLMALFIFMTSNRSNLITIVLLLLNYTV